MQFPFQTVLVPTDFSECGNAAVSVAFALAKSQGARVLLAHVLEGMDIPTPLYSHYAPRPGPEEVRKMEEHARAELERLIPAEHRAVPHEILLLRGQPSDELCRAAAEKSASVIVISSHGRRGLQRLILGSVAERVAHRASCSVLLLR